MQRWLETPILFYWMNRLLIWIWLIEIEILDLLFELNEKGQRTIGHHVAHRFESSPVVMHII
ncbi:MAG: hypothetical protein U5K84_02815 [Alkalibacterium sp.]|nr:hypothetical protein [Alkalibacterium sp.]